MPTTINLTVGRDDVAVLAAGRTLDTQWGPATATKSHHIAVFVPKSPEHLDALLAAVKSVVSPTTTAAPTPDGRVVLWGKTPGVVGGASRVEGSHDSILDKVYKRPMGTNSVTSLMRYAEGSAMANGTPDFIRLPQGSWTGEISDDGNTITLRRGQA